MSAMSTPRKLIVTHHAPDLDAIGSVWVLKRFDAQHYASARVTFVNPGQQLSTDEAAELGYSDPKLITHVDTGLGEFDHHQPERGNQFICATSLVFDHACRIHPELVEDAALQQIVEFITEIDHFGEIYWPEPSHPRYAFMLPEIIRGVESTEPHDDDSQLQFGLRALDFAYANLTLVLKAASLIEEKGQPFTLIAQNQPVDCLAIATENDETIKVAQKQGFHLVIRKDPQEGNVRIKARPDSSFDLQPLHDKILTKDTVGTWYYHPSGKMLLNGSSKHRDQKPSPLSLEELIQLAQEVYV